MPSHGHMPIEIYGTKAALSVPDPNRFGGEIETATREHDWRPVADHAPLCRRQLPLIGVADMAHAIRRDRPHRASGALAFMCSR